MSVFVLKCFEFQNSEKVQRGYLLFSTEALADNYLSYAKSDLKKEKVPLEVGDVYEKLGTVDVGDFLQKQVDQKRTFFTGDIPALTKSSF